MKLTRREQQPALDARAVNIAVSNPQDVRHLMDDDWTMKDHGDLVTKHFQSDTNESLIRDIIREFIVLH